MRVYRSLNAFQTNVQRPLSLGIGNFDGVHLGHQILIDQGQEAAEEMKGRHALFSFLEHPQAVLHPDRKPRLLTSWKHKLLLLSEQGVKECILLPFTKGFSEVTADEFVRQILIETLHVRHVQMGYNARFGHNREGTPEFMKEMAELKGFKFRMVEPVCVENEAVSSSRIREAVKQGNLSAAKACLGRNFSVMGEVIHGDGRGAEIGFPTANIKTETETLLPAGVYAVRVRVAEMNGLPEAEGVEEWSFSFKESWQSAVLNFGHRPTFKAEDSAPVMEVHIFDTQADIYGKTLEIELIERIRDEMRFDGIEAIKAQISNDIQNAKKVLETAEK